MTDLLVPGEVVERYRVERRLGAGGMAQVFLVEHETLHTRHALKVLTLAGPSLQDRLVAEGRVQANLRHPNLVHVSDVLTVKGLPALVMEYVDGPDLNQWIRVVRPDPPEAERMFRLLVAGVAAAHAAGVVHRDLKPGNVFVTKDAHDQWIPKIGDFGLVKALAVEGPGHTRAGLPMGTPQYMPPEQIRDAATVDQRADVFALGCVLYELLAHHQAYPGTDLLEIFTKISDGTRDPLPDRVPRRLAALVDWCLATEPADRPQDCAAVLRGLDGDIPSLKARTAGRPWPGASAAPMVPLVLGAGLSSVVLLSLLVLAVVAVVGRYESRGTPLPLDLPPCPTDGDDVIGWVRAPEVFTKSAGSAWTLLRPTAVVKALPTDGPPVETCVLPAGAQVPVSGQGHAAGAVWLPVRPSKVVEEPRVAEFPDKDDTEVAADRCRGADGEVLGWFFARPKGGPFPQRPKKGRPWHPDHPRWVFTDTDERSAVACALPNGAEVQVGADPLPAGDGVWVPVVGGSVHD
jgi:serine/threonine-protein kinase